MDNVGITMAEISFATLLDLATRLQEAELIPGDLDLEKYIGMASLVCHIPPKPIILSLLLRGPADL